MLIFFFLSCEGVTENEAVGMADAYQYRYLHDCYCYGIAENMRKGTRDASCWALHHL